MKTYGFTLRVEGVPSSDEGFERFCNTLFEFAPDCTPGISQIGFDRDAPNLRDAVTSAVANVHRADPSVTVVGVELDEGQTLDDLLGLTAVAAGK